MVLHGCVFVLFDVMLGFIAACWVWYVVSGLLVGLVAVGCCSRCFCVFATCLGGCVCYVCCCR